MAGELATMQQEVQDWKTKIFQRVFLANHDNEMFRDALSIYAKGGCVLGLMVLRMMLQHSATVSKSTIEILEDFDSLGLIKDWDFTILINPDKAKPTVRAPSKKPVPHCKDGLYGDFIDDLLLRENPDFGQEGNVICIVRHQPNIVRVYSDDALFETSIGVKRFNDEHLTDLEIPMTSMMIPLTNDNYEHFFEMAEAFYQVYLARVANSAPYTSDLAETIKRLVLSEKLEIVGLPATGGFFDLDAIKRSVDYGPLTGKPIAKVIEMAAVYWASGKNNGTDDEETKTSNNIQQFLACQTSQIDRLFVRMMGKNLGKSIKITEKLGQYRFEKVDWLLVPSAFDGEPKLGHRGIIKYFIDLLVEIYLTPELKKLHQIQANYESILFGKDFIKSELILSQRELEKTQEVALKMGDNATPDLKQKIEGNQSRVGFLNSLMEKPDIPGLAGALPVQQIPTGSDPHRVDGLQSVLATMTTTTLQNLVKKMLDRIENAYLDTPLSSPEIFTLPEPIFEIYYPVTPLGTSTPVPEVGVSSYRPLSILTMQGGGPKMIQDLRVREGKVVFEEVPRKIDGNQHTIRKYLVDFALRIENVLEPCNIKRFRALVGEKGAIDMNSLQKTAELLDPFMKILEIPLVSNVISSRQVSQNGFFGALFEIRNKISQT